MNALTPTSPADHFIEQMGLIVQADGGPRIAGRIIGLLVLEGRALTLQQIAERLKVSRASVSTNARLMAGRGILRLTAQPGDRQDYYELTPDPYPRMLDEISARMRRSAEQIEAAHAQFPPEQAEAAARIGNLAAFFSHSADFLDHWASHLKTSD